MRLQLSQDMTTYLNSTAVLHYLPNYLLRAFIYMHMPIHLSRQPTEILMYCPTLFISYQNVYDVLPHHA